MAIRLFFFLLGFGLAVVGGVSCVVYLNVMEANNLTMEGYIRFIVQKVECQMLAAGILVITAAIFIPVKEEA